MLVQPDPSSLIGGDHPQFRESYTVHGRARRRRDMNLILEPV